jgi:hypothetical protein
MTESKEADAAAIAAFVDTSVAAAVETAGDTTVAAKAAGDTC